MNQKISIITACLSGEKYIENAINSVLDQSYENFEHIIIDGGSKDGTISILKKYPHLKWISEPDNGQSDAMNKGFQMSSGDIIVYLNADDYFLPGAFKSILAAIEKEKVVVGSVKIECGDGTYWVNNPKIRLEEMVQWWKPDSYCYNPVGYFYRREVQETVGGFNIENHHSMDLEFLLKAARKYRFYKVNRILGVFRLHENTKTQKSSGFENLAIKFDCVDKFLEDFDVNFFKRYRRDKETYIFEKRLQFLKKDLITHLCIQRELKKFASVALLIQMLLLISIYQLGKKIHRKILSCPRKMSLS